ncbi:helix-turn-helix domain-containing protein [Kitasatospora purpeofusca]|uniref:helix-turn-helix domain-containing protein n=1 Tax=Kitasatospora purpeofusca TaxID=67352 RepID=UPI00386CA697|nr:AraC family transcriptional regulator [Kitasatospora purpeofusca]
MYVREQGTAVRRGLSGRDGFEQWRELLLRTMMCEATIAHTEDFTAEVRRSELGPVAVVGTSFPSARFRRTERMVRQSDEDRYHVTLMTAGALRASYGRDRLVVYEAGELILTSSDSTYDSQCSGVCAPGQGGTRAAGIGIALPVSSIPIPPHRLRGIMGRGVSGRRGTGALLAEFLVGVDRQAADLCSSERARLGTVVVDLVAAWIARELDVKRTLSPDVRDRAIVEGVRSFVRRHLHDPDLTPPALAAAHHISVSHLHRLFTHHSHGETVAAYIRGQRMAKAHRDLANPALRALPIHTVAARCGLLRASDFGRAFKAAYGLSPREHRRRTLSAPVGDETDGGVLATQC